MPRDGRGEGLPPPLRGARTSPDMREDVGGGRGGGTYGKLGQLAEMGGEADTGGEEQAAQLVMSAAQQLMQAAQIHPQLQPMIGRVLAVLKSGVDEMSGGAGGMGVGEEGVMGEETTPTEKPRKRKRTRPPTAETQPDETSGMMGGY